MTDQYQFGNVIIEIHSPVLLRKSPVMEYFRRDVADIKFFSDYEGDSLNTIHLQVVIKDYYVPEEAQYLRSSASTSYYLMGSKKISVYQPAVSESPLIWLVIQSADSRILYISPSAGEKYYSTHELLKHMGLINMLLEYDVWVFHSCYVKTPYGAVLFTGNSGVGKSTQGRLWEQCGCGEVINGDRCVIYQEKGRYMANGFVYSGSSGICKNSAAPVRAIVFLVQSSKNEISRITPGKGIKTLYLQTVSCPYRMEENDKKLKFVTHLFENVEMIQLNCRPDADAVQILQEYLRK